MCVIAKLSHLPSMIKTVDVWKKFPVNQNYSYDIDNRVITYSLKELLEKLPSVMEKELLDSAIEKKIQDARHIDNPQDVAENLSDYLYYMGWKLAHQARKCKKIEIKEISNESGFSESFIKWYLKSKKINYLQITCDHIYDDCYTDAGQFYNSVGICAKCQLDQDLDPFCDLSETIGDLYKAWKAAKKRK
jgi:hypothetical protein